jgi:hypothetical protein
VVDVGGSDCGVVVVVVMGGGKDGLGCSILRTILGPKNIETIATAII